MSDSRVVNAAFELHDLNGVSRAEFAKQYCGENNDVVFLNDGTAHVVSRLGMLAWHGNHSFNSFKRINDVIAVYCGLEDKTYRLPEYAKLLRGVYRGVNARVNAITLYD